MVWHVYICLLNHTEVLWCTPAVSSFMLYSQCHSASSALTASSTRVPLVSFWTCAELRRPSGSRRGLNPLLPSCSCQALWHLPHLCLLHEVLELLHSALSSELTTFSHPKSSLISCCAAKQILLSGDDPIFVGVKLVKGGCSDSCLNLPTTRSQNDRSVKGVETGT